MSGLEIITVTARGPWTARYAQHIDTVIAKLGDTVNVHLAAADARAFAEQLLAACDRAAAAHYCADCKSHVPHIEKTGVTLCADCTAERLLVAK